MNCLLSLNCDTLNGEEPCEFGFLTNYKSMRLKQYIAQKTRPGVGIDQKPFKIATSYLRRHTWFQTPKF